MQPLSELYRAARIVSCLSSLNFIMPHFRARLAHAITRVVC